jgi:hypothetical protein
VQKRLVLVCEGSLCPRKRPDVSGSGLEEARRYTMCGMDVWVETTMVPPFVTCTVEGDRGVVLARMS